MLRIAGGDSPIVIADLDGCLSQNPPESFRDARGTINDVNFWARHWNNVRNPAHDEMIELLQVLMLDGYHVVILTARPERFRDVTKAWLEDHGLYALEPDVASEMVGSAFTLRNPALVMLDEDEANIGYRSNWKADVVEQWVKQGARIAFAIEDYKPNADALRPFCPVLLYERKRP